MRNAIKPERLELLMSFISERDLPKSVRTGLRYCNSNHCTYEEAAEIGGTTRQAISRGHKKIYSMHLSIYKVYMKDMKSV